MAKTRISGRTTTSCILGVLVVALTCYGLLAWIKHDSSPVHVVNQARLNTYKNPDKTGPENCLFTRYSDGRVRVSKCTDGWNYGG